MAAVAPVRCFVCGAAVTPGKERSLQVRPRGDGAPCFPFLQRAHPPPGAHELGADGSARVCAVCHLFLGAQWDAFERAGTRMDQRAYWLKRPHECEPARTPCEWEPSSRSGNQNPHAGVKMSRRPARRWHPKCLSRRSQVSPYGVQVSSPSADAPEQRGDKKKKPPTKWVTPPQSDSTGDAEDALSGLLHSSAFGAPTPHTDLLEDKLCRSDGNGQVGTNEVDDDDDDDDDDEGGGRQLSGGLNRDQSDSRGVLSQYQGSHVVDGRMCYVCGSELRRGHRFKVWVQKQERRADRPFFPFLWLCTPPPGAVPLNPGGCALVCRRCHGSLVRQWQAFEVAGMPVLQQLYTAPPREACYLCGGECGRDVRVALSQEGRGESRCAMYFPFIRLLPHPPGVKGLRDGQVNCCTLCFGILEDIWAEYRRCLDKELIASPTGFLGRYHQALGGDLAQSPSASTSTCYLCGGEAGGEADFQVRVTPAGRCHKSEPFFPFLSARPPAPRAKTADSTGLVSTCVLCFHDLCAQWVRHEGQVGCRYRCDTFVCFFCRQERRRCLGLQAVRVARLPLFLYPPRVRDTLVVDDGNKLIVGSCAECKAKVRTSEKRDSGPDRSSPARKHKLVLIFARIGLFYALPVRN
ncbi:genetic suppressor element 1 isoform X1 [Arapaima gigas]